jgi:hypothetical protein
MSGSNGGGVASSAIIEQVIQRLVIMNGAHVMARLVVVISGWYRGRVWPCGMLQGYEVLH